MRGCFGSPPTPSPAVSRTWRSGSTDSIDAMPDALPLGVRQRLSLAVAMIHAPDILILDEPTSGVDPVARDRFWQNLSDLSRKDNVTIFISTHFMNEAERCDRMSLMHAGKVLISDTPQRIAEQRGRGTSRRLSSAICRMRLVLRRPSRRRPPSRPQLKPRPPPGLARQAAS